MLLVDNPFGPSEVTQIQWTPVKPTQIAGRKDVIMGATRRKFTFEHKMRSLLIELQIPEGTLQRQLKSYLFRKEALYRWVKDERIRLEAASGAGEGPLSGTGDESS